MHWRNSNFQKLYFIVQGGHTADEMYRRAKELFEERQLAIDEFESSEKFKNNDFNIAAKACYDEALREKEYIKELIEKIEPHRKYKDLPDHDAHQAAQQDYWLQELKYRAENHLFTTGVITPELLSTMRLHPQFKSDLLPHMLTCITAVKEGRAEALLATPQTFAQNLLLQQPAYDNP